MFELCEYNLVTLKKRLVVAPREIWQDEARMFYLAGHSGRETLQHLRKKFPVSDRALRMLLCETQLVRNRSEAHKLVRWTLTCSLCKQSFQGRTPTAVICDVCTGDSSSGVTKQKLRAYCRFRKIRDREERYGIDEQAFQNLLSQQENKCGLCLREFKQPCLDHDHSTGLARGLLCHRCNLALGQVELGGGRSWLDRACLWLAKGGA